MARSCSRFEVKRIEFKLPESFNRDYAVAVFYKYGALHVKSIYYATVVELKRNKAIIEFSPKISLNKVNMILFQINFHNQLEIVDFRYDVKEEKVVVKVK